MRAVTPLEIGLMFWALPDPHKTLTGVEQLGFRCGQLGIPGELALPGAEKAWVEAIAEHDFAIATAFCSYAGESYASMSMVEGSVGLVPPPTRAERVARTKEVSDFAAEIGIPSIACHVGFVPHDQNDPVYAEIRDVVRDLCDHCASHQQTFALETGQEPADVLLRFLNDVQRPNLKINFDPANLILYGTGQPLAAVEVLAPHIVSVHLKDGDPPSGEANALGKERALGEGSVDIPAFLSKLRSIGYTGILSIEREEPDPDQRDADIRSALTMVQQLTQRSK